MNTTRSNLPSREEALIARTASQELSAVMETKLDNQSISINDAEGNAHVVDMPVSALRLLVDVLTELGDGNTVKLVPIHAELTTQEAADMLNVSRPTFVKMLDDQLLPYTKTGNRRKVLYTDVQQYKEKLKQQRLASLSELSALDQELGLGYQ